MAKAATDNDYLKGKLLLAMPDMGDPRFSRSVIFICAHDKNGAMGLVVNQTITGIDGQELLEQFDIIPDQGFDIPIYHGGPVETSRGFILHSNDYLQSDTVPVVEGFSVTGTIDALRAAAKGEGPKHLLFALGYSGWTAGQLDNELQQNAWLVVDADPELIFTTPKDHLWAEALKRTGIDPAMLSPSGGRA